MLTQFPTAHTEVVTSLTFSPHDHAGNLLCSTSGDDTIAMWDCHGNTRIALLVHHREPVNDAVFLPDNPNALLTASDDRTIGFWDLRRPDRVVGTITGFHGGINKLLVLPTFGVGLSQSIGSYPLVASACDDGQVYIHSLVGSTEEGAPPAAAEHFGSPSASVGRLVDQFWAATSTVNDLIIFPNSGVLVTASEDCALRSWRLLMNPQATTDDRLICSLDEFENPVNHVAMVPPGLMQSCRSAALDTEGPETPEGSGAASGGSSALQNKGNGACSEADDCASRCWVVAACSECVFGVDLAVPSGEFGQGTRSFIGHKDYVRGLQFSAAGTLLTVSDDSTVMEWDLAVGEPIRQVKVHDGFVMASGLSPQRDKLATGSHVGEIRVWQLPFQTERMGA